MLKRHQSSVLGSPYLEEIQWQTIENSRLPLNQAVVKRQSQRAPQSRQRQSRLIPDQTRRGQLTESDQRDQRRGGTLYDDYQLANLAVGQRIAVRLNSAAFDPYLQLIDRRNGRILGQNDDMRLGNHNSSLAFTVRQGVRYVLRVTSYKLNAAGTYRLQVIQTQASDPATLPFDSEYGYGLLNANAAVSRSLGRGLFADTVDTNNNWGLQIIQAAEVWRQDFTGQGITIAVLDTGIDRSHPDLANNLWRNLGEIPGNGLDDDRNGFVDDVEGWSFIDQDSNDPTDAEGHGTHVAGIIAAADNGIGMTGVAPNAKIMPVRVLGGSDDYSAERSDANVAAGIRYAVKNGARIINMSLGRLRLSSIPMVQTFTALELARQAGVVVVMSSGNDRDSGGVGPTEPASYAYNGLGIAVGAIDNTRRIADFSTPAGVRRLDYLVAPGVNILSTIPGGGYASFSGTSMAAPHVTGAIALMLSANPKLTPTEIANILLRTAVRRGLEY
jgi:subtilisin family serine protease